MADSQSAKGNPAAKRMGNARRKARRAASWLRGQAKKQRNRELNESRRLVNVRRRAAGEMTPWEQAQAIRRERRQARKAS